MNKSRLGAESVDSEIRMLTDPELAGLVIVEEYSKIYFPIVVPYYGNPLPPIYHFCIVNQRARRGRMDN